MKKFVSKNWFRLMIGLSAIMFSFGFMVYSISPSYSNSKEIGNKEIEQKMSTNGIKFDDGTLFVDGGRAYLFTGTKANEFNETIYWESFELPE